jgi:hypothetical protein
MAGASNWLWENLLVRIAFPFMELSKRVKIGLDETSMLLLGAQVLSDFNFEAIS